MGEVPYLPPERHRASRYIVGMERPRADVASTVLGAPAARDLAGFYERLLGWERTADEENWVVIRSPDGIKRLSFQTEADHVPPVWPAGPKDQQMMMHLDVAVENLEAGVAWALESGATLADQQPQDDVRVLLDPAGHPFCLFPWAFDAE